MSSELSLLGLGLGVTRYLSLPSMMHFYRQFICSGISNQWSSYTSYGQISLNCQHTPLRARGAIETSGVFDNEADEFVQQVDRTQMHRGDWRSKGDKLPVPTDIGSHSERQQDSIPWYIRGVSDNISIYIIFKPALAGAKVSRMLRFCFMD